MSDTSESDVDSIRERKRERLESKLESPAEPIHVEGQDHLTELVEENGVLLVDFYADWCGPCKMLEPTVESIAAETDAAVAKVDVDEHQAIAREYNVQGVPTLFLFVDGEAVERLVGVQEDGTLTDLVEQYT